MPVRDLAQRWLPRGNTLSPEAWSGRHRLVLWVTSLHVPVLALVGIVNGENGVHIAGELSVMMVLLIACVLAPSKWMKAVLASTALTTSSALLVHFTGGLIESHFHFLVALPLIALYADWRPFGAAIVYVLVHHAIAGTLDPTSVYNHPAAITRPLLWGSIHAGYVALLCVVMVIHWRFSEDEQQATHAALRRLEEVLASKDELIASVSHEIRTPLTGILGFTTELAENPEMFDSDERTALLSSVAGEAQELANIVEDLLTSARARIGTLTVIMEPVDLSELARSVRSSTSFRDSIVECRLEDGVEAVADPLRVKQVIRNLITNAQRHGGPGIELRAFVDGHAACVEVRDDGPGLHPTVADRVFEPYVTAADRGTMPKSIGLGLAVSQTLAESMGGHLTFHRGDDGHSVFRLSLPIAVADRLPRVMALDGGAPVDPSI